MNPFKNTKYRAEQEIGSAYKDIKKIVDNLELVQKLAQHIDEFRAGNIELKSIGATVYWKYTMGTEWYEFGDLSSIFSEFHQTVEQLQLDLNTTNQTVTNNRQAAELANTATNNRIDNLVSEYEQFVLDTASVNQLVDNALEAINGTISGMQSTLTSLGNTVASHTIQLTHLDQRVRQLEPGIVRVHYKDDAGNTLSAPLTMKGKIGDNYTTTPKEIPGYEVSHTPENHSGVYTVEDIAVTYIYDVEP